MTMTQGAREEILNRLKEATPDIPESRPVKVSQVDLPDDIDGRIAVFTAELETKTGVVHRVGNNEEALAALSDIVEAENIKSVLLSGDDIISALELEKWGVANGITVMNALEYNDKNEFRTAAFEQADAGITGADFAFAESATLAILHDRNKARLVSAAPPIHIAILPVDRLYRYYEDVVPQLYGKMEGLPSQMTFITGPSATADIAATPTVGMHGPKKLFTIFIG